MVKKGSEGVEKGISFRLNRKIYPIEAALKTNLIFSDRLCGEIDKNSKGDYYTVLLTGWENNKNLKNEYLNELTNVIVRENLVRSNKKVLEYIVGGAITASLFGANQATLFATSGKDSNSGKEIKKLKEKLSKLDSGGNYKKDPLGIMKVAN